MAIMIGVDVGTTSTKVIGYSPAGEVVASASQGYPLSQTTPGMAEEDPAAIFDAVVEGIAAVTRATGTEPVAGVSFSVAMHSLILIDDQDRPLTRAITWADNRALAAARQLAQSREATILHEATGVPVHPMTPLSKLVWLRTADPALLAKTRWVADLKSYLFHAFFSEWVVDYSIANATGLFAGQTRTWYGPALALAGITTAQLPRLVDTTTVFTGLTPALAARLGLPATTPFIIGAADGPLSNLGLGAIGPGQYALTVGTSGAIRVAVDRYVPETTGKLFNYYLAPGRWVVGGPTNNGGNVLSWVHQQVAPTQDLTTLLQAAAKVTPGADGLLFLPYLAGERAPLWDGAASGSFIGLTLRHTQAQLIRAALEGVAYNLAEILHEVESLAGPATSLQAGGGFANSPLWCQVMADVFARPLHVPASVESSALGAALLGMRAVGLTAELPVIHNRQQAGTTYQPQPANVARYQQTRQVWETVGAALQPQYQALARLRQP